MARTKNRKQSTKAVQTKAAPLDEVTRGLTEEGIRRRAYEVFQTRLQNGQPGDAQSDWLRAETELVEASLDSTAQRQPPHEPA